MATISQLEKLHSSGTMKSYMSRPLPVNTLLFPPWGRLYFMTSGYPRSHQYSLNYHCDTECLLIRNRSRYVTNVNQTPKQ